MSLITKLYTCLSQYRYKEFMRGVVTLIPAKYLHLEEGKRYYLLLDGDVIIDAVKDD